MICEYDLCQRDAKERVRTVLGIETFCAIHAWIVRQIEADWDRAEAEYLEQT